MLSDRVELLTLWQCTGSAMRTQFLQSLARTTRGFAEDPVTFYGWWSIRWKPLSNSELMRVEMHSLFDFWWGVWIVLDIFVSRIAQLRIYPTFTEVLMMTRHRLEACCQSRMQTIDPWTNRRSRTNGVVLDLTGRRSRIRNNTRSAPVVQNLLCVQVGVKDVEE